MYLTPASIEDYRIVVASMAFDLESRVKDMLKQGYVLHGNPYSTGGNHCQAMVKYGEPKCPVVTGIAYTGGQDGSNR